MREVKAGECYRHFKNGLYRLLMIALDEHTGEPVAVYQELFGDEKTWVCPLSEFTAEVDQREYPDADQRYRFELFEEPEETDPMLLRFLEAETYREKLELFQTWEGCVDAQLLESIAVTLDVALSEGSTHEKYRQILNCLKTMEHFETDRFR